MSSDTRRALVLAANLFEDRELLYPTLRLREAGVIVTVVSMDGNPVTGLKGHGPMKVDGPISDVAAEDYDLLVIPGGFAPDAFRVNAKALELTRQFDEAGKPIAFICHAGWLPISAGIIAGRRATSYIAIRDDMINAGCNWVDEATVVDGNLISARHPDDLGPWCRAMLAALNVDES